MLNDFAFPVDIAHMVPRQMLEAVKPGLCISGLGANVEFLEGCFTFLVEKPVDGELHEFEVRWVQVICITLHHFASHIDR